MSLVYGLAEVRRTLRSPLYLSFSIGMPVLLFLLISSTSGAGRLDGVGVTAYVMVSMATFAVLGSVFSTSGRIASERLTGWHRQLRLTALTQRQYVTGKLATGFAVALPAMAVVLLAGAVRGVRLDPLTWLAVSVSVLLAAVPVALLGVWLGYAVRSEDNQAIAGGAYSLLGFAGGLWIPVQLFPDWLQDVAAVLPVVWVAAAGRAALAGGWLGWHGTGVLTAWTVVLGLLAVRAYGRDAGRA